MKQDILAQAYNRNARCSQPIKHLSGISKVYSKWLPQNLEREILYLNIV